jgi:hypothetical protein
MLITSASLKEFSSAISRLKLNDKETILFLDINKEANKALFYISSGSQIIALDCPLNDIKEDEYKVYALAHKSFLHSLNMLSSFEMKSDYSYNSPVASGVFENNESYLPELDSIQTTIKEMSEKTFTFTASKDFITIIKKAIAYLDKDTKLISNKTIYCKDGKIVASSSYRIYEYFTDFTGEMLLPYEVATFLELLGPNTNIIITNNKEYILEKEDIKIYFGACTIPTLLPLFDSTHPILKVLQEVKSEGIKAELNTNDFSKAIDYMKFYANSVINNKTLFSFQKDETFLQSQENKYKLSFISCNESMEFFFNLGNFEELYSKVLIPGKIEKFNLYVHPKQNIYTIEISENEFIHLSKITN